MDAVYFKPPRSEEGSLRDFVPLAGLEFFHAPAVRENSMKKIGNRKEHLCDYASFPDSQPNVPLSRSDSQKQSGREA